MCKRAYENGKKTAHENGKKTAPRKMKTVKKTALENAKKSVKTKTIKKRPSRLQSQLRLRAIRNSLGGQQLGESYYTPGYLEETSIFWPGAEVSYFQARIQG